MQSKLAEMEAKHEADIAKVREEGQLTKSEIQDSNALAVKRGSVPTNMAFMCVWQLLMLLCFAFFTEYDPELFVDGDGNATGITSIKRMTHYGHFQDVHVMIFIGFGFLMTFLRKYGMSALSVNMMVAIFALQWHML